MKEYKINPVPKPRMTKADKWKKRASTTRYWEFKDEINRLGVTLSSGDSITFIIPMPKSWSKSKRKKMLGEPHTQKPDIDNLLKAVLDSIYEDDSHIYGLAGLWKYWGDEGAILITTKEEINK